MNVRNQMDIALDHAADEHMKELFKFYFVDGDLEKLRDNLRKVEATYKNADKVLDTL